MSIAYLDSSAFLKLVLEEPHSTAMRAWLRTRRRFVSSGLLKTEALRGVSQQGKEARLRVREALEAVALLPIGDDILEAAGVIAPGPLRSLDAIHLATALQFASDLDAVVTYDQRMIEAAERLGLPVASPA